MATIDPDFSQEGCIGPGPKKGERCGKARHSALHCRTHHRQVLRGEALTPIRRYYTRDSKKTVAMLGLRVTPRAAKAVDDASVRAGLSTSCTLSSIVNAWSDDVLWRVPAQITRGVGALGVMLLLVAGGSLVRCAGAAEISREALIKPLPSQPLDGQATPPCEKPLKEMVGACWGAVLDPESGGQLRGCLDSEQMYADKDGRCWLPAPKKSKKPKKPNALEEYEALD